MRSLRHWDFECVRRVAGHVTLTTPRNDTHIVVTEYGWADLKGKSMPLRADALIGLAHPRFREELADSLR